MSVDPLEGIKDRCFSDLLPKRAAAHPDRVAIICVGADGNETARLTYGELHQKVERYAAALTLRELSGSRALMLFEPGAGFVIAFLACLRAGVVALPANVAKPGRTSWDRLTAIARDSQSACILTETGSVSKLTNWFASSAELSALDILSFDGTQHEPEPSERPRPPRNTPAFLQYPSGSTGNPKGTIITFGNLAANAEITGPAFGIDFSALVVTWLPPYHDLGLIGNILQTLYAGAQIVLLPPVSFVQNPARWLEAISRYRATVSMAPNFAYELCVRRIPPERRAAFDLSTWRFAVNAAEPIRASTIARFHEAFSASGFRAHHAQMAYGLAEATLVVSATDPDLAPKVLTVQSGLLDQGKLALCVGGDDKGREIVSSGSVRAPQRVAIVEPESRRVCDAGTIGEIWVAGPCVASGYWQRREETEQTFCARTADGDGPFLRTGDLGIVVDGELYVTGRIKEVIVVRGRKIYPQDIEATVQRSHEALKPAGGAAFAVDTGDAESLVIVQEVERTALGSVDRDELVSCIAQAVFHEHDLSISEVVLVKPEVVPKTSSGKIQRVLCRDLYARGELDRVVQGRSSKAARVTAGGADEHKPQGVPGVPALPGDAGEFEDRAIVAGMCEWLRRRAQQPMQSASIEANGSIPAHIMLDIGRQGLLGMNCPETLGGRGLSLHEALHVMQQLGAIDLRLASFVALHNCAGVHPLLHASHHARVAYVASAAAGRELIGFALRDAGAGAVATAPADSSARRTEAGSWKLSGTGFWTVPAGLPTCFNFFAPAYDEAGTPLGMTGFHVGSRQPGVDMRIDVSKAEHRTIAQGIVHLSSVLVDDDAVLGAPGHGLDIARDAIARMRLFLAASALGGVKCALGVMERHATEKVATAADSDTCARYDRLSQVLTDARALEVLIDAVGSDLKDAVEPAQSEICLIAQTLATERLWIALHDAAALVGAPIGKSQDDSEGDMLARMIGDARYLGDDRSAEQLVDFAGSALEAAREGVVAYIDNRLHDKDTAAMLRAAMVSWKASLVQLTPASARRMHSDIGRVLADAVMFACGKLAAAQSLLSTGRLQDRLTGSIARTDALWLKSKDVASESTKRLLAAARACSADVAPSRTRASGASPSIHRAIDPSLPGQWCGGSETENDTAARVTNRASDTTAEAITSVICDWFRSHGLHVPSDHRLSFAALGLDSLSSVELAHFLATRFRIKLDETILYVYPTFDDLARHLSSLCASGKDVLADEYVGPAGLPGAEVATW